LTSAGALDAIHAPSLAKLGTSFHLILFTILLLPKARRAHGQMFTSTGHHFCACIAQSLNVFLAAHQAQASKMMTVQFG
jgi:hypothetical protein